MTPDTNAASGLRHRTVLSAAGTGALGALAGCLSAFSSDGSSSDDTDDTAETGEESTDEPLTDYEYTEPPQIVDLAEQDHASTLRALPARHQIVSDEATGGPADLPPSVPAPSSRATSPGRTSIAATSRRATTSTWGYTAPSASIRRGTRPPTASTS